MTVKWNNNLLLLLGKFYYIQVEFLVVACYMDYRPASYPCILCIQAKSDFQWVQWFHTTETVIKHWQSLFFSLSRLLHIEGFKYSFFAEERGAF